MSLLKRNKSNPPSTANLDGTDGGSKSNKNNNNDQCASSANINTLVDDSSHRGDEREEEEEYLPTTTTTTTVLDGHQETAGIVRLRAAYSIAPSPTSAHHDEDAHLDEEAAFLRDPEEEQ